MPHTATIQAGSFPSTEHRTLIALSGGVDSVVLAYLAAASGWKIALAHAHFGLRPEADADQAFCEALAKQLNAPFFTKKFNTKAFAEQKKLSIQEAARVLRYQWFADLQSQHDYPQLATAHHADDSIETFFINLFRGSGIHGLSGITSTPGQCIRPLLCFTKTDILEYATAHNLTWREDVSNQSSKYLRNQIRHTLLPTMEGMRSGFMKKMQQNLSQLEEQAQALDFLAESEYSNYVKQEGLKVHIHWEALLEHPAGKALIHHYLKPYGINATQLDLLKAVPAPKTGSHFITPTHHILVDRGRLLISPLVANEHQHEPSLELPTWLNWHTLAPNQVTLPPPSNSIFVDAEALEFPLMLRKWQQGDRIKPLGMRGKSKLISDLLIDHKLSTHEKEQVHLLTSGGKVLWAAGIRQAEHAKITKKTSQVLCFSITNSKLPTRTNTKKS